MKPAFEVVDRLAELARDAEPPPLEDARASRMISRALREARDDAPDQSRVRWLWPAIAVALACSLAFVLVGGQARERTSAQLPVELTLPTGDRLVGAAGVRFEITELATERRRFRLDGGTMMFDVARISTTQHVAVTTPHAIVRVTGTVFSVAATSTATFVHVYEGTVEVERGSTTTRLAAGSDWQSDEAVARVPEIRAVREAAQSALRTRIATTVGARAAVATSEQAPTTPMPSASDTQASASIDAPPPSTPSQAPPRIVEKHRNDAPAAAPAQVIDVEQARALLVAGRFEDALNAASRAWPMTGAWQLVRGDALRGLNRATDAADAFDAAAALLGGAEQIEAAFSAGYLRFHVLGDPAGALVSLRDGVYAQGSPLEERGLVLRARALDRIGRKDDARSVAQRYVERFPHGSMHGFMKQLLAR